MTSGRSEPVENNLWAELGTQAAIALALSNSGFYRNFLERFLVSTGKLLRLPWWAVHLVLYLASVFALVSLLSVPRLYPHAGYISFGAEQVGEFLFTTFMLWHLRKSRSIAILAAARLPNGKDRLIWLRKFLAPSSWGWSVRFGNRRPSVSVWLATSVVLIAYWGGQFLFYRGRGLRVPHVNTYWDTCYPYPQLLYLYPTLAKAAMFTAAVAHFWWLSGLMSIVRGQCPSALNVRQRRLLYLECSRAGTEFIVMVSLIAVLWVFARALAYGFGFWAYLYSLSLLLLFAAQVAIFTGTNLSEWLSGYFFRELITSGFVTDWPVTTVGRLAGLSLVWGPILGLGPLAQLIGSHA